MKPYNWSPNRIKIDRAAGVFDRDDTLMVTLVHQLKEQPLPLIAFAGFGRTGKDGAATVLIEAGYHRCALGDYIKEMSLDQAVACPHGILDWMSLILSGEDSELRAEMVAAVVDFDRRGMNLFVQIRRGLQQIQTGVLDPYSTNDHAKKLMRPALEWLGMWRYQDILARFVEGLQPPAVNTRLMRLAEAKAWKEYGGTIIQVLRPGVAAQTDFEHRALQSLQDAGMIDYTIDNNGTLEDLWTKVLAVACL